MCMISGHQPHLSPGSLLAEAVFCFRVFRICISGLKMNIIYSHSLVTALVSRSSAIQFILYASDYIHILLAIIISDNLLADRVDCIFHFHLFFSCPLWATTSSKYLLHTCCGYRYWTESESLSLEGSWRRRSCGGVRSLCQCSKSLAGIIKCNVKCQV